MTDYLENKIITIRSTYGKFKEYHFQPCKQRNGLNHPFVKKVRYNADGTSEMILSNEDLNNPESQYFIPEDMDIVVMDGTTFDLSDPLQRNKWLAIKDSDLIVPTRDARDEHGNLIIDGDKRRYGLAELWIDVPGEESEKAVNRKKLITKAWTFIENDSASGRLTKCKLLGRIMRNAPDSDVTDFLYQKAEKSPNTVIELYTSSDMALKLLVIDAKDRNKIIKKNGMFMYGDTILGATDDAVIQFCKTPANKTIVDMLKADVYPEYVRETKEEIERKTTSKSSKSEKE